MNQLQSLLIVYAYRILLIVYLSYIAISSNALMSFFARDAFAIVGSSNKYASERTA